MRKTRHPFIITDESTPIPGNHYCQDEPVSQREDIYEQLSRDADLGIPSNDTYFPRAKDCMRPDGTMPVRHPDSARFHDLLVAIGDMHDRKQSTYGRPDSPFSNYLSSKELGIPPWRYVVARVCEKISRLQSFAKAGADLPSSTKRELMDIAACSLIAIVLLEKNDEHLCNKI